MKAVFPDFFLFFFCHYFFLTTKSARKPPGTLDPPAAHFLDGSTHLYMRVGPSDGWSVRNLFFFKRWKWAVLYMKTIGAVQPGPHTGADTPDFFRGPTASGGPRGAQRGPYEGFFCLTKGKKIFLPMMMLLRFNSQYFSLFQEPLWSSFGIISYPI